jgi:hypothetical protein
MTNAVGHHERMKAYWDDLRREIVELIGGGMGRSEAARTSA